MKRKNMRVDESYIDARSIFRYTIVIGLESPFFSDKKGTLSLPNWWNTLFLLYFSLNPIPIGLECTPKHSVCKIITKQRKGAFYPFRIDG